MLLTMVRHLIHTQQTMGQAAIHTVLLDMAVLGDTRILQTTPAGLTPLPACRIAPPMDVHRTA